MKLYTITYTRPGDDKKTARWAGTQADAARVRMDVMTTEGLKRKDIHIEDVDVPTKKEELLEWLNGRSA